MTRGVLLSAILVLPPLGVACGRRGESSQPAPSSSPVASEVPSARPAEVAVGDLVDLPTGTGIAPAPGASATAKSNSSPALILGVGGAGHRRLLLADGSSGWTAAPVRIVSSTRVSPTKDLELARFPPGDPRRKDSHEKATVVLAAHAAATIIGASFERDAPSERALRLDQAPFLEQPNLLLQLGPTSTGFVHGLAFDVEWTTPPAVEFAHLARFRGIVRRPFLGPLAAPSLSLAPRAGESTHVVVDTPKDFDVFRLLSAPAHKWSSLEALVVDPEAKPGGIATLAVVGDGGALAFVFVGEVKRASVVFPRAEIGSPWITRTEMADLDGDGLSEWVVELVDRTSHGVDARLLIVAGSSLTSGISSAVLPLGGEPGEGDPTERYAWYVEDRKLFVARDRDSRAKCQSVSMTASGPILAPSRVVSIKTYDDARPARLEASGASDGRRALPITVSGERRWITGRCFLDAKQATVFAARVGGHVL